MRLPFRPRVALLCAGLLALPGTGFILRGQKKPVPGQNSLSTEQVPAQTPQDEPTTKITLDVTRVNVLFTVTDKKGRFVTDLVKDDFQVMESKKQQNIQEFTAESDELTPTLKVKRRVIDQKYREVIDGIYSGAGGTDFSL